MSVSDLTERWDLPLINRRGPPYSGAPMGTQKCLRFADDLERLGDCLKQMQNLTFEAGKPVRFV
jgi:hypothetical protein